MTKSTLLLSRNTALATQVCSRRRLLVESRGTVMQWTAIISWQVRHNDDEQRALHYTSTHNNSTFYRIFARATVARVVWCVGK
jgi:hypothetical protein